MNTFARSLISALALGGLLTLAGCGGGTGDNPSGGKAFNNSSGGGTSTGTPPGGTGTAVAAPVVPPPPIANQPSLVLTLADPTTGGATTSVPAVARAIVRDDTGAGVPNVVVTFATTVTLASLVPPSGTALTDSTGTATVRLNAASLSSAGATTLTATAQAPGFSVTGSIGFAIGPSNVTISNFTVGTSPLSSFGTTSISVVVNSNGVPVTSPQTVTFSSACASSGKAVLTASSLTGAGGVALASYRDNGCGGNDTITASVSGLATAQATLNLTQPTAGSIRFISATPPNITLKGTGGAGLQESSLVIFQVVDTGGNPLNAAQTVTFSLSTAVGGVSFANGLTTTTAASDPQTGQAAVTVQAGTVSTPVRILATTPGTGGTTLSTQSDQLTITTGIPTHASMSLSAETLNIEGWDVDGETTTITVRLADHFGNPVPDRTAVNLITEGGSIGSLGLGSCLTVEGACTATLTSQELRPTNGRLNILAYAVGEESFTDLDGDGYASKVNRADGTSELFDANGFATDIPEAFLDSNENGIRDANETFIDFNRNNAYNAPDGSYNGVLCNESAPGTSSAGTCSAQKSLHVFRNLPVVFSGSTPVFRFFEQDANGVVTPINTSAGLGFTPCVNNQPFVREVKTILTVITDVNGNPLPAGTTVDFFRTISSDGGPQSALGHRQINTNRCLASVAGCPASAAVTPGHPAVTFPLTWRNETFQTVAGTCVAPFASDSMNVRVVTPNLIQTVTTLRITY